MPVLSGVDYDWTLLCSNQLVLTILVLVSIVSSFN